MRPIQLLSLLPRRPKEFFDRAAAGLRLRLEPYVRSRPNYSVQEWAGVLLRIGQLLNADLDAILAEDCLSEIQSNVQAGLIAMPRDAPFPFFHNGDFRLARLSYALVRALEPACVVETGVCYGVTSAFILKALERNSTGTLYSIDLPPLGQNAERFVGWLVPQELRSRWRLSLGTSKEWLPRIVEDLEGVDIFLHDSLHTYGNIRKELHAVTPKLRERSVVIADDIEGNSAFLEWVAKSKPTFGAAITEESKEGLFGIGLFYRGREE